MVQVKLQVLRGASAGKEIPIRRSRFVIGRAEECHLRAASDAVSRRHCELMIEDEQVVIEDLGSKNGTYVNGQRLDGPRKLSAGDQLRIGPLEFLVQIGPAAGSDTVAPASEPTSLVAPAGRGTPSPQAPGGSADMGGMVSQWLAELDEADRRKRLSEPDTREFRLESASSPAQPSNAAGVAQSKKSDKTKKEKGKGTKDKKEKADSPSKPLKAQKKEPAKDSQEAAAQILRKLMNRG